MKPNYIILADCDPDEISTFSQGCEQTAAVPFSIRSAISNKGHGSLLKRLGRYASYFTFPFGIFLRRRRYDMIVGWQQFHAINFAFFCRLTGVKKRCKVVCVNYTYKTKPGLVGRIYERYMRYAIGKGYVDAIHVPSHAYADEVAKTLGFPRERIIVIPFGTPDNYEPWSRLESPVAGEPYSLAIGRSNRDFDFLAAMWSRPELKGHRLVIISDSWKPTAPLPPDITHLDNVVGDASFPYIANCRLSLVPVEHPLICSGDTVLLNSMMMLKPVVVTSPSTLAEMYVTDGFNGLYIDKTDIAASAAKVAALLESEAEMSRMGRNARESYMQNFSRTAMGRNLMQRLQTIGVI